MPNLFAYLVLYPCSRGHREVSCLWRDSHETLCKCAQLHWHLVAGSDTSVLVTCYHSKTESKEASESLSSGCYAWKRPALHTLALAYPGQPREAAATQQTAAGASSPRNCFVTDFPGAGVTQEAAAGFHGDRLSESYPKMPWLYSSLHVPSPLKEEEQTQGSLPLLQYKPLAPL